MLEMRVKYRNSYQWSGNCCIHIRKATDLIVRNNVSANVTCVKNLLRVSFTTIELTEPPHQSEDHLPLENQSDSELEASIYQLK